MNFIDYNEAVMDYLEYLGYPDYVTEFEPECVAKSITGANRTFWNCGMSIRMAALSNFGLTWTMQIIPSMRNKVKH